MAKLNFEKRKNYAFTEKKRLVGLTHGLNVLGLMTTAMFLMKTSVTCFKTGEGRSLLPAGVVELAAELC